MTCKNCSNSCNSSKTKRSTSSADYIELAMFNLAFPEGFEDEYYRAIAWESWQKRAKICASEHLNTASTTVPPHVLELKPLSRNVKSVCEINLSPAEKHNLDEILKLNAPFIEEAKRKRLDKTWKITFELDNSSGIGTSTTAIEPYTGLRFDITDYCSW